MSTVWRYRREHLGICLQTQGAAEAAITGLSGCVPEAVSPLHGADQSYRGVRGLNVAAQHRRKL